MQRSPGWYSHMDYRSPFIAWDPDSVESDGFLGSGEGEDDPDSEESDFE